MFRFAAAVAALSLCASGAAQAQSFDDFMQMCVAPQGDPALSREAADAAGWKAASPAMVAYIWKPEKEFNVASVMAAPGGRVGLLISASGNDIPFEVESDSLDMQACILLTETVSIAGARARFLDLKLGAPIEDEGNLYYILSRSADGRLRDERALIEGPEASLMAAVRARSLFFVGVMDGAPFGLIFARLSAAEPTVGETAQ